LTRKPGPSAASDDPLAHRGTDRARHRERLGAGVEPRDDLDEAHDRRGLKKCMPTTRPGSPAAAPSVVIGIEDVFDARTASARSRQIARAARA
jgi:hypothetical protein